MRVTKGDVIWNYVGTFMSLGSNLFLLPFIMYYLDGESLGLWYIFLSIGGIVTLFDFGFNPTLARNIAYCWSGAISLNKTDVVFVNNCEPNFRLLKKVIVTCKRIYLIISISALIVLLSLGTMYISRISNNMEGYNHILAWLIYSIAVFLNLYYGYYTTFLRGVGAIKQINVATVFARWFQIITSISLLYLGFKLVAVAVAFLGYGLIFRYISKMLFYKYEDIGSRLGNVPTVFDVEEIKQTFSLVWHNAWRDGLVSLSRYLSSTASIVISSMFLSLTATGIYSISIQLITAIGTMSGALYTTYQPSLQAAHINNDIVGSGKIMSMAMTVYIVVFWIGLTALVVIGMPILSIIKPDIVFSIPILIAIAIYQFLLLHHSYYASFISNTNNVPYVKSFLVSSIAGVLLSVLLIRGTNLGIWGLIIAQIVVQLAYNNWVWPLRVMKSLDTNLFEMFKIGAMQIRDRLIKRRIIQE